MTSFSIKNSVLTLSIVFVLAFMGINKFSNMPQNSMPPYTVRFSSVVTTFPGASPKRVEMLVTDKIEKQLQQIAEAPFQVLSGLQDDANPPLVVAGSGGFLAKEVAMRLNLQVIELEREWGDKALAAFPALAVAYLLAQEPTGRIG